MDPLIGKIVSHYRILERIGAGGMGAVYRAEDTKLGRTVALKFLHPDLTRDAKAKQRFIQEARAASAMEHSNICTIYEVDEVPEDRIFISMAYYPGKSLKERIAEGPLEIREALDIAVQVAQGLAKAHAREIVHRDIKPGNILITQDGEVKIVDFGLAKLAGQLKLTSTGKTIGTISYMSPEQASGGEIGPKTDIWALGVMLYEMVTGTLPFTGEYEAAMLYSILHDEPAAMSSVRSGVPEELEKIVKKALAKNPSERYEDASALLSDLGALKQRMTIDQFTGTHEWRFKGRGRRRILVIAALGAAAIAAVVIWQFSIQKERGPAGLPGRASQVTSGDVWQGEPAISPDGTAIAYASEAAGNRDIYTVGVKGGARSRLTDDPASDSYPAWFPDGNALAFVSERGGAIGIWKVGRMGGGATLLIRDAVDPAISPDGTRIACAVLDSMGLYRICAAPLSNPAAITMLTGDDDGIWQHRQPAWSPDGNTICYGTNHDLWTVPARGGAARRLTSNGKADSYPAWSSDGKRVYFSSDRDGALALWRVAAGGGTAVRITLGSGYEHDPSVCGDGGLFAYATQTEPNAMFVRDMRTGREERMPDLRDNCLAAIAPDGSKVVCATNQGGGVLDLWIQPLANGVPSGQLVRLTEDSANASCPAFSPDGKWIAYYRIDGERRDIYTIPVSGGRPIRFTDDPAPDVQPAWSPDGSMLAFVSERGGATRVWIAPVLGGEPAGAPRAVTDETVAAASPSWSGDGKSIAFIGCRKGRCEVWIVPADASEVPRRITTGAQAMLVRWDSSARALLVSGAWDESRFSVRRISLDGASIESLAPPIVLGPLSAALPVFDLSLDGRYIVFAQESTRGAIWIHEAREGAY